MAHMWKTNIYYTKLLFGRFVFWVVCPKTSRLGLLRLFGIGQICINNSHLRVYRLRFGEEEEEEEKEKRRCIQAKSFSLDF